MIEAFEDDFDRLREVEEFDGKKVSLLIDCLLSGSTSFSQLEQHLLVQTLKSKQHLQDDQQSKDDQLHDDQILKSKQKQFKDKHQLHNDQTLKSNHHLQDDQQSKDDHQLQDDDEMHQEKNLMEKYERNEMDEE